MLLPVNQCGYIRRERKTDRQTETETETETERDREKQTDTQTHRQTVFPVKTFEHVGVPHFFVGTGVIRWNCNYFGDSDGMTRRRE